MATAARERDALERLTEILADLAAGARPVAGGNEVVVALDLALRHDEVDRARAWVVAHAAIIRGQVEALACLPATAKALVDGFFAAAGAHSRAAIDAEVAAVEAAVDKLLGAATIKPKKAPKVPKVQRRRVSALYSQVYLEPVELTASESTQIYFQAEHDSASGMSLFETKVGVATPSDTESVDVRVVFEPDATAVDVGDALQAVCFPIAVREGGVCLRGVADQDGEPLVIPPGRYDVAAVFTAPARRDRKTAGLRKLGLVLSFRREGALDAPRTLRIADDHTSSQARPGRRGR